jgi:hypothetical protein
LDATFCAIARGTNGTHNTANSAREDARVEPRRVAARGIIRQAVAKNTRMGVPLIIDRDSPNIGAEKLGKQHTPGVLIASNEKQNGLETKE